MSKSSFVSRGPRHGRLALLAAAAAAFVTVPLTTASSSLAALSPPSRTQANNRLALAFAGAGTSDWLAEINRYRLAAGLTAVVDQPAWDLGLEHHLTYLEKTPSQYFTGQYQSLHTENPASPYYTPDGAQEAGSSDLSEGDAHTPVDAIDGWLAAPFHAVGMLRSQLTQVAFADDPSTGFAGLDVTQGLDSSLPPATSPILLPGPGVTTNLLAFSGESPDPLQTCGWQGSSAGLPIVELLPQAPVESLTARLNGPGGIESSTDGTLCVVDENTYESTDPVYGPTGASLLQDDDAVFLIPRRPLETGKYDVDIEQSGEPSIAWSFSAQAPIVRTSIKRVQVKGHSIRVQIATPAGTALRCALTPRVGRAFARPRFSKCSATTTYPHVARGTYRLLVRSSKGNASRDLHVS